MGHASAGRADGYGLVASVAHLHCGVPADRDSFREKFYGDSDDPTRLLVFVGNDGDGARDGDAPPPQPRPLCRRRHPRHGDSSRGSPIRTSENRDCSRF